MHGYEKGHESLDELLINGGPIGFTEFAEIVEDTAIENHVHAKRQTEWDSNINSAIHEANYFFSNYISSFDNKHIYYPIIEILIQYSFSGYIKKGKKLTSIIDTSWDDFNLYFEHIIFFTKFQKKYELKALYWNNRKKMHLFRPFANKLPLDLQELKMKYYYTKGFYNFKNSHLNVSFDINSDDELLEESVTLFNGVNVILKDLIFSHLEKRIAPDGIEYTKQEFEDYFGGLEEWGMR